ncbi:multiheme c-type cytochrome [Bacillaceae bacterium IKA-2]|nr:multiheme c-type cytochrome [Bacillaceae bacterium IKA-2]
MKKSRLLVYAVFFIAMAIIVSGCSSKDTAVPSPVVAADLSYYDKFVGPDKCADCHDDHTEKWETSWHTKKTAKGPNLGGGELVWDWVPEKWDEMDSYLILDQKDKDTIYLSTKKYELEEVDYTVGSIRKQRYMVYYDGSPQEAYLSTTENGGISWNIDKSTTVQFEGNLERAGYNFLYLELHAEDDIRTYGTWRSWQEQCIGCHTTGFNPDAWAEAKDEFINGEREDLRDTFITTVEISCESCHGPGKDHVEFPLREGNIINPVKLDMDDPTRKMVCEQCHTRAQTNLVYGNGANDNRGFMLGEHDYMDIMQYTRPAWGTGNRQVSIDGKGRRDHQQDMDMKLQDHIKGGETIHGQLACFDCHDSHNVGNNPDNPRTFGEVPVDNCRTCHGLESEERMEVLNGSLGWETFGYDNWDNEGGRNRTRQHVFNLDEEGRTFGLTPDQYIWAQKKDGNAAEEDGWESIWPWEQEHYEENGQKIYIGATPWKVGE